MDLTHMSAYELIRQEELTDIRSMGYLLRHKKSGARVMLIENDDDNKVFNIAFRTVPHDSTGVTHIMEHTVLCGSRQFPPKDPFVELIKGSMNTFLNAMTYPDKTMFPVASTNDRDFANLMHVYMDAVFYPNIYSKEEIFRQEGWSYQIENQEDDIVLNGVVYNEMKGAFSSPDDVLARMISSSLYPDTTYFFESGGDPACIPDLTYEAYLDFHRTYYQPSNAYIVLYGKMDFEERLDWMDREYLQAFDNVKVDSEISLQTPFEQMHRTEAFYPIAQEEEEEDNTYFAYNISISKSTDIELATAMDVLEYALLEAPGAPVKQALLDAGIGSDIQSSYDSGVNQPYLSIIAKGANAEDEQLFMDTIRESLEKVAREGVDEKAIMAAINMMEFKFREADYGSLPKGLLYAIDCFDSWLYNDDMAFDYLFQLRDFDALKKKLGTDYYTELVKKWLIENPFSSLVVLKPQRGLAAETEEALERSLADFKASLSKEQIQELIEKTEKLRAFQETPSTQEELEAIPMLSREDLNKNPQPLQSNVYDWDGVTALHQDYETNGIAYIQLLFDASAVPAEDLSLFCEMKNLLGSVDTEHYGFAQLSNEINMNTGGISTGLSLFPDVADTSKVKFAMGVQAHTLNDKIGYAFGMIEEILFTSNLEQEKRILELLRMARTRVEHRLSSNGSGTASVRAMAQFSQFSRITDDVSGVSFYRFLKDMEEHYDEKKADLFKNMKRVLKTVLDARGFMVSITGDREAFESAKPYVLHLRDRLKHPEARVTAQDVIRPYPAIELIRENEGLKTSAKVQYVARCGNFREAGYDYSGAMKVLRTIMSYEYLWSNIRVVGGAYGCSGSFSRSGDTVFVSYRDPHLRRTNEIYEGIPEYLKNFTVDERDMTKYVIGTVSDMDTPMTPLTKGSRSLNAWLTGVTYERLQQERDEVLSADQDAIRALAPAIEAALNQQYLCVLGNETKLDEAKDMFDRLSPLA